MAWVAVVEGGLDQCCVASRLHLLLSLVLRAAWRWHHQQVGLLLLVVLDLVLLLSLMEPKAGVEAGEVALLSAFSSSPIPC